MLLRLELDEEIKGFDVSVFEVDSEKVFKVVVKVQRLLWNHPVLVVAIILPPLFNFLKVISIKLFKHCRSWLEWLLDCCFNIVTFHGNKRKALQ